MRVRAVQTGQVQVKRRHLEARFGPRPARVADVLADREWGPWMPVFLFAIEHPGGTIVVDTGETARALDPGHAPRWHVFSRTSERRRLTPDDEAGPRLRALGIDPDEVRTVVLTHMHGDHTGGLWHFPNAEVLVSAREARMALARTGPVNGYFNRHYPPWLRLRTVEFDSEPWEGFAASVPLTPGCEVRLVPTPGHTAGHMSVVVERAADDVVMIVGDAAYTEAGLLAGRLEAATPTPEKESRPA